MAEVKVFVSSTCYDLAILRSELRAFITDIGYRPILSEYADITYDPAKHTHVSCINEVENCDIFVLIIGSRYGGVGVPSALENIDARILNEMKNANGAFEDNISITQLEVAKAIELNIPIYTFIDKKVYYIHEVYEKNKDKLSVIDNIDFPGIEKKETARYIFEFFNFVRKRTSDNFFFPFENTQDIKAILKKQWAGYFKLLMRKDRNNLMESKKFDSLNEQLEDLKAAIISSIEGADQKQIAKGIVKYRQLVDFLLGIKHTIEYLSTTTDDFGEVKRKAGIIELVNAKDLVMPYQPYHFARSFLIKEDQSFFGCRLTKEAFTSIEEDWETFKAMNQNAKRIIIDTLKDMSRPGMLVRYSTKHIEDYVSELVEKNRTIENP